MSWLTPELARTASASCANVTPGTPCASASAIGVAAAVRTASSANAPRTATPWLERRKILGDLRAIGEERGDEPGQRARRDDGGEHPRLEPAHRERMHDRPAPSGEE